MKAVVLLSGGLDSTTALAVARRDGYRVFCLSFAYGQRHSGEIEAARKIASIFGAEEHRVMRLDLGSLGGSALTDTTPVPRDRDSMDGIPVTYVPARNTVFFSIALAWAETLDADAIFVGINALDYSGYPDCRPEYLAAFQKMADLATKRGVEGRPIRFAAPLLALSKAEIIRLGTSLGVNYSPTTSCYDPSPGHLACGHCDACLLRRNGFAKAGVPDPTRYVLEEEP